MISTGATITYPSIYSLYSFADSGSVTFNVTITVDLFIVGGGGGGGGFTQGGGGGGGGIMYATGVSIPAGSYDVVVGGGGAMNTNGNPSSAFGASANGGGAGGSGGSGVFGANGGGGCNTGGSTSSHGGFASTIGVLPTFSYITAQLIGGVAGETPGAYSSIGGNGGGGYLSDITGDLLWYAYGGYGGAANSPGGSNSQLPGGGGGGGVATGTNHPGGKGIVLIRMAPPTSCPLGQFIGEFFCLPCTNGRAGAIFISVGSCQNVCAAGYYGVGTACVQCAVGRYSGVNSTNCSACNTPAGGYVFTTAGTNSTNCLVGCAAGWFTSMPAVCSACTPGELPM